MGKDWQAKHAMMTEEIYLYLEKTYHYHPQMMLNRHRVHHYFWGGAAVILP
jgi:hypothetical protein